MSLVAGLGLGLLGGGGVSQPHPCVLVRGRARALTVDAESAPQVSTFARALMVSVRQDSAEFLVAAESGCRRSR